MSRHRYVRNMDLGEYDDGFDDDYSDEEPGQELDPDNQYIWKGSSTSSFGTAFAVAPPPQQPDDASLLNDLAAQFRLCLNDDTIQESTIDAAIIAADYDVDAALQLLREQREAEANAAANALSNLELTDPSPIAQMLDEGSSSLSHPALPDNTAAIPHQPVEVHSGNALLPRNDPQEPIVPFKFDKPSPDDILLAKQAGAGERKKTILRMPKASALRSASKRKALNSATPKSTPDTTVKEAETTGSAPKPPKRPEPQQSTVAPVKVKQRIKQLDLTAKVKAGCSSVSVVVAGHVDAGKSTLLGHMLQMLEAKKSSEGKSKRRRKPEDLAWGTDEDSVERARGVTIDIATRIFKTSSRNSRTYAMIDAPGHRDFVPAMILGATQASAALLVVDASPGEFEAGFSEDGQTKEHTLVLKSLGVNRLIVVVNKMDVANFEEERYTELVKRMRDFLRGNGWKVDRAVSFVAASGREGLNLITKPEAAHPMMQWYKGMSVLEAIEALPHANSSVITETSGQPTRLIVSDFFRSASLGGNAAVTGRLLCGSIAPKDKLAIVPGGAIASVKNLETGSGERNGVVVAGVDSLPISISLMDLPEGLMITPGSVLCDPEEPVPIGVHFKAQVLTVTTGTPLIPGTKGVLHIGGGAEAAAITRLCEYVINNNKKGARAQKAKRPRRLVKGDAAIVEITCDRGVAMEKSADVKALSRFALRQNGRTVAVGIVTDILKTSDVDRALSEDAQEKAASKS